MGPAASDGSVVRVRGGGRRGEVRRAHPCHEDEWSIGADGAGDEGRRARSREKCARSGGAVGTFANGGRACRGDTNGKVSQTSDTGRWRGDAPPGSVPATAPGSAREAALGAYGCRTPGPRRGPEYRAAAGFHYEVGSAESGVNIHDHRRAGSGVGNDDEIKKSPAGLEGHQARPDCVVGDKDGSDTRPRGGRRAVPQVDTSYFVAGSPVTEDFFRSWLRRS